MQVTVRYTGNEDDAVISNVRTATIINDTYVVFAGDEKHVFPLRHVRRIKEAAEDND